MKIIMIIDLPETSKFKLWLTVGEHQSTWLNITEGDKSGEYFNLRSILKCVTCSTEIIYDFMIWNHFAVNTFYNIMLVKLWVCFLLPAVTITAIAVLHVRQSFPNDMLLLASFSYALRFNNWMKFFFALHERRSYHILVLLFLITESFPQNSTVLSS